MASNNDTLKDYDLQQFNSSWVAQHKICYTVQDGQNLLIKVNFPRLPQKLKADLWLLTQRREIDIHKYPQVKGYIMEVFF